MAIPKQKSAANAFGKKPSSMSDPVITPRAKAEPSETAAISSSASFMVLEFENSGAEHSFEELSASNDSGRLETDFGCKIVVRQQ